ncbi:hypothetical protein JKP88DRAFT_217096 [Tribonema minus]|uniref:RRM domain-containing protein n=1 Tax=Tribonema minus TaxID=303371 RepID=A0A835ZNU8_9STRA|nr:hypothetical protein JKP88DRAFT_217096 [Tribonema minus]
MCKTWQILTGQAPETIATVAAATALVDPNTKTNREIFVGNVPLEAQADALQQFLGSAMQQVGLTTAPGNPIVHVRMNARFSFLEFRSMEEATHALFLNNIPFGSSTLTFARPSKYAGPVTPTKSWFETLADSNVLGNVMEQQAAGPPPSTVVRIGSVVNADELVDDESYQEVIEDMREECSRYGTVLGIEIPRNAAAGVGYVFVQYSTVEEATKARNAFSSRTFDGKQVDATFFGHDDFAAKRF